MSAQNQVNRLATVLAAKTRAIYEADIGRLLEKTLIIEHQTLVLINPNNSLHVILLGFLESDDSAIQENFFVSQLLLVASPAQHDAEVEVIAAKLLKGFLDQLDGQKLRQNLIYRPRNAYFKRIYV